MNRASPQLTATNFVFRLWLTLRQILPKQKSQTFGKTSTESKSIIEKAYVINLDRAPDRWVKMKQELGQIQGTAGVTLLSITERCVAVDGKEFSEDPLEDADVDPFYTLADQLFVEPQPAALPTHFALNAPIRMSRSEIAVVRSHIKVWKQVASGNCEFALILEDDVLFSPIFARRLDQAWSETKEQNHKQGVFDILYLSYDEVLNGAPKTFLSDNIFCPVRGLWYLSGYVLSRTGAKKLIQLLPCSGPIDLWINHKFDSLDVRALKRPIINQRRDTKSSNSYSILPSLTKIGAITSEGASLFNNQPNHQPVFAFGPGASGNSSLAMALSMLGYRCCSDFDTLPDSEINRLVKGEDERIFNAYVNIGSLTAIIKELRSCYSNAKFILIQPVDFADKTVFTLLENELLGADVAILSSEEECKWNVVCEHLRCAPPTCSYPKLVDYGQRPIRNTVANSEQIRNTNSAEHDKSIWVAEPHSWWRGIDAISLGHESTNIGETIQYSDSLNSLDTSRWLLRSDTFTDNLVLFRPKNVEFTSDIGAVLSIRKENLGVRDYSGASLCSRDHYLFGRFEATIQASDAPGVVTGFFLHRNSPRQEIDIEIIGNTPNQLLVNVFYNPGSEGASFDYGYRGTPTYIELGFDASKASHRYAIEWSPLEIRWLVDEQLVHTRKIWNPTPIPHLPMMLHVNSWLSRSKQLAGRINNRRLPTTTIVRSISLSANSTTTLEKPDKSYGENMPTSSELRQPVK